MAHDESDGQSPREWLREWLRQQGFSPLKSLGQHFLVDPSAIGRIVEAILGADDLPVLEIGPGLGALTEPLLARNRQVAAIELDRGYAQYLRGRWGSAGLQVVEGDALRLKWSAVWQEVGPGGSLVVAGNLPYYIGGPLLAHLWEDAALPWTRAVLMLQREAAARVLATPGEDAGSVPAVMLRTVGVPRRVLDVGPEAFYPAPDVFSTVIEVSKRDPWSFEDRLRLKRLVAAGYGQRRKTLRRAMTSVSHGAAWMEAAGVDPGRRAETLSMQEWRALVDAHQVWETRGRGIE